MTVAFEVKQKPLPPTHFGAVTALFRTEDGARLVSASRDGTVRTWPRREDDVAAVFDFGAQCWASGAAAFAGTGVAACGSDGGVRLWAHSFSGATLWAHRDAATAIASAPQQQQFLLTVGTDASLRRWDTTRIPSSSEDDGAHFRCFVPKKPSSVVVVQPPQPPPPPPQPAEPQQPKRRIWSFWRSSSSAVGQQQQTQPKEPTAAAAAAADVAPQQQTQVSPSPSTDGIIEVEGLEQSFPAPASLYSLAVTRGNVALAGSAEGSVFAWDFRTGGDGALFELDGHMDVVRSLVLLESRNAIATASSDNTVRLWDLRQRRCFGMISCHRRDVWSISAAADGEAGLWSCGRDGKVFWIDMSGTGNAHLALDLQKPLSAVCSGEDAGTVWIGAWDGSISLWKPKLGVIAQSRFIREAVEEEPAGVSAASMASSTPPDSGIQMSDDAPVSASQRPLQGIECEQTFIQRSVCVPDVSSQDPPVLGQLLEEHPAAAGIVRAELLNDKMRVLSKDSDGTVRLWNVLRGTEEARFENADFRAKLDELQGNVVLPPWCTINTTTGRLLVSLSHPSAFHAVAHTSDFDSSLQSERPPPTDKRVNLGEVLLDGLFSNVPGRRDHVCRLPLEFAPETRVFQTPPGLGAVFSSTVGALKSESSVLVPWLRKYLFELVTIPPSRLPSLHVILIDSAQPEKAKHRIRVLCNAFARPRDLADVVVNKLKLPVPSDAALEDIVSFTCREQPVPSRMNAESIRRMLWRSSDTVELLYTILVIGKAK